jgi:hypothetical protein
LDLPDEAEAQYDSGVVVKPEKVPTLRVEVDEGK